MFAILSADLNWGIGCGNDLLIRIPDDLKRFREMTINRTVVMGRHTLLSLPGGKPLPQRKNIVLSRDAGLSVDGAKVVHSLEELFLTVGGGDNVAVIGGEQTYRLLLPHCGKVYVTKILKAWSGADKFFPNIDESPDWKISERSEIYSHNDIGYQYVTYERNTKPTSNL